MKRLFVFGFLVSGFMVSAQSNTDLLKHYEVYYKQMKTQGDVQV